MVVDGDLQMFFDITIDKNFLANALTSAMQLNGDLDNREYITIEFLEMEGEHFNIVAKRNALVVN